MSFLNTPNLKLSVFLLAVACLGFGCGTNKDDTTSATPPAAPTTPAPSDAKPQPPAAPQAEPVKPDAADKSALAQDSEEGKKTKTAVRNKNLAREAELRTFLYGEFSAASNPSASYEYKSDLFFGLQNTVMNLDDSGGIYFVYRLYYNRESITQSDHFGAWHGRYVVRADGDRYTLTYVPTLLIQRAIPEGSKETTLYKLGTSYTCELAVGKNDQGRRYFTLKKCSEFTNERGFYAPHEVTFTSTNET